MDWHALGRLLAGLGVILVLLGLFIMGLGRFFHFGSLPGDIVIRHKNFTFYFPLVTCLVLSIILSLIFRIFFRK